MSDGIFGDLFDINNDGTLDVFEKGLEFQFLDEITKDDSDSSEDEGDYF